MTAIVAVDWLIEQILQLEPDHEGESPGPNNWYFDGFAEAIDKVESLLLALPE